MQMDLRCSLFLVHQLRIVRVVNNIMKDTILRMGRMPLISKYNQNTLAKGDVIKSKSH